jgi:UDP-N-acetyl-D-glucosamine dehydrogenase
MPHYCIERIELALNSVRKPVRSSVITVLGVSYKAGIGDIRESPAIRIIEELQRLGADVRYHDPFVPALPSLGLSNIELSDAVDGADAIVLVTAHPGIDHAQIARDAELFIDLRGATRGAAAPSVVRL